MNRHESLRDLHAGLSHICESLLLEKEIFQKAYKRGNKIAYSKKKEYITLSKKLDYFNEMRRWVFYLFIEI